MGAGFYGFFLYTEERFDLIEKEAKYQAKTLADAQKENAKKVAELEDSFLGTKTTLTEVLMAEQSRNNSLTEEFNKIMSTVTDLAKLSATDKELLKKYSKNYFLNEHYVPISLSNIDPKFVNSTSSNFQIHSNVKPYLEAMLLTANSEGMNLRVQSAYRSFGTQSALKSAYTVTYGAGTANKFSADQGYSEHQLGTTVDFTTEATKGALVGFDKTPEYQWLLANAYRFGFVISYPAGNAYYKFEPWHWRFVGIKLATRLHNDGIYFYDMDQRVVDSYLADIFE